MATQFLVGEAQNFVADPVPQGTPVQFLRWVPTKKLKSTDFPESLEK